MTPTPFTQIQLQPTTFLWNPYLPKGRLTLLAADPGLGKTALILHLAAALSHGITSPQHGPSENPPTSLMKPLSILILSPDTPGETLLPRLLAENADLARIHHAQLSPTDGPLLTRLKDGFQNTPPFDLLIIDDILLPKSDASLLANLAQRTGITILLTTRLTRILPKQLLQDPTPTNLRQLLPAIPYANAAASVLLLLPALPPASQTSGKENRDHHNNNSHISTNDDHSPEESHRLLLPLKSPLPLLPRSLAFQIADSLVWSLHSQVPIHPSTPCDPLRQSAAAFLRAVLANGPLRAYEVLNQAKANAISLRTLERAKAELNILSSHPAKNLPWFWSLPDDLRPPPLSDFDKSSANRIPYGNEPIFHPVSASTRHGGLNPQLKTWTALPTYQNPRDPTTESPHPSIQNQKSKIENETLPNPRDPLPESPHPSIQNQKSKIENPKLPNPG